MLTFHFLNVGKGNCTVIDFPSGNLTVIDTDNSRVTDENELTDRVEYLKKYFDGQAIFRMIITHPDMDHLSGLEEIDENFQILNFWDTDNTKVLTDESFENCPYDIADWKTYQRLRKSTENPKARYNYRGQTGNFWNTDKITILSPTRELVKHANETENWNELSYVLRIDYQGKKILLGGESTSSVWDNILKDCGADALKADVFFAPHHGSPSDVNDEVFKLIDPEYVIISVADGVKYDTAAYAKLARKAVYTTREHGNIRLSIDSNGTIEVEFEKELSASA